MALRGTGNFSSHVGDPGGGAEIHPAGNLYLFRRKAGAAIFGSVAGGGAAWRAGPGPGGCAWVVAVVG